MKHVLVTVLKNGRRDTFRVSATNAGEWKTLARPDGKELWSERVKGRALAAKLKVLDSQQLFGGDGSLRLSCWRR